MSELSEDIKNLQVSDQIFKNIKFFVSGEVLDKVVELLKCGGAERMNYFTDYVTHMICGHDAEETDVSDANDLYEIPAVNPKWVLMCVKLRKLVSTKPYAYDNKKLFSGLVFCFSKITADRNALWSIITFNGGLVQLNFTSACTHLVTTSTNSSKYIKAFSLGAAQVEIITPDWVVESARSKSLVQVDLFHPKLIIYPKVIKHESTTAITGFEPEPSELEDKADNTAADSTQALLDKLKQRMPWNQPPSSTSKDIVPPNVVAPSFTAARLPLTSTVQQNLQQAQQQRAFAQLQSQPQQQFANQSNIVSANQIARSVVHHTAQSTLIGQPQPQLSQFSQQTQLQLAQSRLQQQQQQQRANLLSQITQQQVNKGAHLGPIAQQAQFSSQQVVQRGQMGQIGQIAAAQVGQITPGQVGQITSGQITQGQINPAGQVGQITSVGQISSSVGQIASVAQITSVGQITQGQIGVSSAHLGQIAQPTPQLSQMVGQNQSIIQRVQQMGQLGKTPVSIQQLQQQLANRQQLGQTLTQQQQQFVNASQQQQSTQLISQGQSPQFASINQQQQLGQVLGQAQQQQHLSIQQTKLLQSQFAQQNQNNQNQQSEVQQQFVNPSSMAQQQHQFGQNQQFTQAAQPQVFTQASQIVQNQFVQNRSPSQFGNQPLLGGVSQIGGQQQQLVTQQQLVNQQQQQLVSQQQQQLVSQQQQQLVNQQQQQLVSQQQQQLVNQQQQQLVNTQQLVSQQQIVSASQQQQLGAQQLVNQAQINTQQLVSQPQIGNQLVNATQQLVSQPQQLVNQPQQLVNPSPIGSQQLVSQSQQLVNQAQQLINQQHLSGGQQAGAQQQLVGQQVINQQQQQQINKPLLLNATGQQTVQQQPQQSQQPGQPNQPKPLWQQQQLGIRHPTGIIQQQQQQQPQQGPRVQWSPTQQQPAMPQRQLIHLDAQTHQQLQQMGPEQRALFIAKLQKQRQVFLQQRQMQMQQQQRAGHVLIRSGPVPQGLNPQQQMQWLQQQAKQQGVMLQQSSVQQPNLTPTNVVQNTTITQNLPHAPGLSPIQQTAPQFPEQNLQIQRQQQFRLQQLQLQREQAQKATPQPLPQPNVIRPIGQPQTAEVVNPTTVVDSTVAQQQLVVNAKTKTALANMLSIRLQSGTTPLGPSSENIAEPSAAGTLRLMTAQHNAALNSNNRPQDILGLPQRRPITGPNGELIRPAPAPSAPPVVQPDPPKLQFSPRSNVPVQHRQGPFYGHNPNLKLPPDLFLLGCIFVVVELDRFLEESLPDWQQQIEKHGGEIEKQYCSRVTHVLCETQRHGVVMQALRDCKRCVTLYWLSDVMKRKQVLPPWTALHLPTMYLDTTPASKHLISLTGFVNSERNRIKHMIKYIGATFTSYFSKHNTLLIASKAEGPKFTHAKKWGTPVVNVQWLTDVMLGSFTALTQMEHIKYQQFAIPPVFNFEPTLVPSLMHAWKMPINISQESYERVKRSPSPVVLPKKVKKIKTEHTNDENENPNDQSPPSATHRILFSMFADTEDLKKMVKDLGGSLARNHTDCTHLIMPYLGRSNKLLHCICLGIYVLPDTWLRDSHAANKFLDHSNYALDTKEFNSEYKCDFNQTLATRNRNKLFEGKFFYITPSVYPSKSVLTELIRSCGGIVEKNRRTVSQIEATNLNSPYSYIILTHANDLHLVYDVLRNKKDKIRTVCNVELIYSAILKQTFEVEPYAVQVCEVRR